MCQAKLPHFFEQNFFHELDQETGSFHERTSSFSRSITQAANLIVLTLCSILDIPISSQLYSPIILEKIQIPYLQNPPNISNSPNVSYKPSHPQEPPRWNTLDRKTKPPAIKPKGKNNAYAYERPRDAAHARTPGGDGKRLSLYLLNPLQQPRRRRRCHFWLQRQLSRAREMRTWGSLRSLKREWGASELIALVLAPRAVRRRLILVLAHSLRADAI